MNKSALDVQVGGGHYKDFKIQPIEFAMANGLDTCQHAILKYICRFRSKGGRQDLAKARHYLDLLEEFEYGQKEKEAEPTQSDSKKPWQHYIPTDGASVPTNTAVQGTR